jgi:hypothetical protein
MLTEYVTDVLTDMFTRIVFRSVPTRKQDSSTSKNPVTKVYAIIYREGTWGYGRCWVVVQCRTVCSTFCVVRETSAKFGLHAGNV